MREPTLGVVFLIRLGSALGAMSLRAYILAMAISAAILAAFMASALVFLRG